MGLFVLIFALLAALTACEPTPSAETGARAQPPHAELACAACHSGAPISGREAAVPAASCTASGCHEAGGPERVELATVTFPHRDHGEESEITPSCAGCHFHDTGEAPLQASVDACALCHVGQVTGGQSEECRLCHVRPDHGALTSQGVAVSHSQLPWTEIGCVRCHYDVAEAETAVASASCRACHDDLPAITEAAVGRDMHPLHSGVTCTSCHAEGMHEVQAMSSAVDLVCSDCHTRAHGVALQPEQPQTSELCGTCHEAIHAPQQRLLLGIRPDGAASPSEKFMAGITCRSCHIPTAATRARPEEPIRGQAASCAGCHEQEYTQVLDWWLEGIRTRLDKSRSYVERAEAAIGTEPDSAAALLRDARAMVTLVTDAGGQHNLELADRLLREAVIRADRAYEAAGLRAPSLPDLGRVPHSGMCSYCHYAPGEPWNFESMPNDFHRMIMSEE